MFSYIYSSSLFLSNARMSCGFRLDRDGEFCVVKPIVFRFLGCQINNELESYLFGGVGVFCFPSVLLITVFRSPGDRRCLSVHGCLYGLLALPILYHCSLIVLTISGCEAAISKFSTGSLSISNSNHGPPRFDRSLYRHPRAHYFPRNCRIMDLPFYFLTF